MIAGQNYDCHYYYPLLSCSNSYNLTMESYRGELRRVHLLYNRPSDFPIKDFLLSVFEEL